MRTVSGLFLFAPGFVAVFGSGATWNRVKPTQVFLTLTLVCVWATLHQVLFDGITELAHSLSSEMLTGFWERKSAI